MSSIIGYIGGKFAVNKVADGFTRLGYKDYDSFGVAVPQGSCISIIRTIGDTDTLKADLQDKELEADLAIGHARLAAHGRPAEVQPCRSEHIVIVTDGIVENYKEIKDKLTALGYQLETDTDTELLTHFVHSLYKGNLANAVHTASQQARGVYSLMAISSNEPDKLIAVSKKNPLVIGINEETEGHIITNDIAAALGVAENFVFMEDDALAVLSAQEFKLFSTDGKTIQTELTHIDWDTATAEKDGFEDFMLKEIYEQPRAILNTLKGRIIADEGRVILEELQKIEKDVDKIERMIFLACGTSLHAGLLGKIFMERYARIPVEVDVASEFVNRDLILNPNILCVCITQSGETADTKAALKAARDRGASTLAICNVVGASIAREADCALYTHAGKEVSIASTKVFTSQVLVLLLLALWFGERRETTERGRIAELFADLMKLPERINFLLAHEDEIKTMADIYKNSRNFMFLGRNITAPIAMEAALKLKETSYIHAEGYPSGELKHGPIALLDENFPVMVFAPASRVQERIFASIKDAKDRNAKVIGIFSECNRANHPECDHTFFLPDCAYEEMGAFLSVAAAQIFAYYCAKGLGKEVDEPRSLSKSVR